jgi:hypothetical protein
MELRQTSEKQRTEIYADLRSLVYPGFLTHTVMVNGIRASLRTLTQADMFLLRHRTNGSEYVNKEWMNWVIASSVWLLDGQVVMGNSSVQHSIFETVSRLPRMFREDLFSIFTSLMGRVNKALDRMEAFLYEGESRFMWSTEGVRMFDVPPFQGATPIQLNSIQKTWVSFNQYEDKRQERKFWWGLAKFIVQPHAPKGIQKLNKAEETEEGNENSRRQRLMDLTYWKAQGAVIGDDEKTRILKTHTGVVRAETKQDLEQEMADWVSGKKDYHDNAIDFVKAKIKGEVEGRREAEENRIASIQHALEEEGIDEPAFVPLMGEAAEAVKRRMIGKTTATVVYDDNHNSAYDKYIKNNPDVGVLGVDEHGNIKASEEVTKNAEALLGLLVKPDEQKNQTGELDKQVQARAAKLRGGN